MTTKHFLFCFLLFIQLVAFGQVKLSKDFLVTVGKPYKVVDAKSKEYFSDGKGFTISVKTDGEVVTLQRYEIAKMSEVNRKEYEDFPDAMKFQKALMLGNRLFYIFSSFNKKEKKEDVYSREVNMGDATFQPVKLLFSTASEVTVGSYGEMSSMGWVPLGLPIRFDGRLGRRCARSRWRGSRRNAPRAYQPPGGPPGSNFAADCGNGGRPHANSPTV